VKKILAIFAIFAVCLTVALTSVNAWAMSFNGSNGYYSTEGTYNATFYPTANKMRHMSGDAVAMQIKGWTWVLVGYAFPEAGTAQFNTTTLNQYKYTTYSRITGAGKAKAEFTGISGGTISADLYISNSTPN
jgi:hypothetical protein